MEEPLNALAFLLKTPPILVDGGSARPRVPVLDKAMDSFVREAVYGGRTEP